MTQHLSHRLLVQPDFPEAANHQKGSRGGVTLIMAQVCARTRGRDLFFSSFREGTMIHNGSPRNPPCLR